MITASTKPTTHTIMSKTEIHLFRDGDYNHLQIGNMSVWLTDEDINRLRLVLDFNK